MRLACWVDKVETPPQHGYKTFKAGAHHCAVVIRVPTWLASLLHRVIADEKELQPCRML